MFSFLLDEDLEDDDELDDADIFRSMLITVCEQALDYLTADECRSIIEASIEMAGKARN